MIVVDTNIMLRLLEPGHPHCHAGIAAISQLTTQSAESFCTVPHCLHEVYHVLTRTKNGHGKSPLQAGAEMANLIQMFPPLSDSSQFFATWLALVARYGTTGRLAYDAKIVAAMVDHRLPALLSFNDEDFLQFTEIKVLNPFDVIGLPRK